MKTTLEVCEGVEGWCIILGDRRICGPKPWGGGKIIARWFVEIPDIEKAISTNAGKPLLERLQEAEWIIRNSVATDTFAATRRDAFLNPKPQDVM